MEVKFNNVSSENFKNINITFFENQITALLVKNDNENMNLINLFYGKEKIENGTIEYDGKVLNINDKLNIKSDIYYLNENYNKMLFNVNIKEDIKFYLGKYDHDNLNELLKSFDLDIKILEKSHLELSSSEIRKILLIIALMSNSKIIILENPTMRLDNKSIQTLIKCLKKLKRKNKIIFISSYNVDFLLEASDRIVLLGNKEIIQDGNKFDTLSNYKILNKVNINVPNVLQFENTVKEIKNIKIGYRDNINDLIKDIFRYAK